MGRAALGCDGSLKNRNAMYGHIRHVWSHYVTSNPSKFSSLCQLLMPKLLLENYNDQNLVSIDNVEKKGDGGKLAILYLYKTKMQEKRQQKPTTINSHNTTYSQ